MKKLLVLLTSVFLIVLAVTGCGSDTPKETTGETTAASTMATEIVPSTTVTTETVAVGVATTRTGRTGGGIRGTTTQKTVATTTARTVSIATSKTPVARQTLRNSYVKLTKQNSLTVSFLGGSVTAGYGASLLPEDENPTMKDAYNGWTHRVYNWLKATYASAAVKEVNAGIGDTGSLYGAARVRQDVLSKQTDLVFIEFAINDSYLGYSQDQSERYMESIVRQCYAKNADMDIVLVYVTDVSKAGKSTRWTKAFDAVATHYGLTVIDAGAYMQEKSGGNLSAYMKDSAHPIDTGYQLIADKVEEVLKAEFAKVSTATTTKSHDIPKPTRTDVLEKMTMLSPDTIQQYGGTTITNNSTDPRATLASGKTITIDFSGRFFGAILARATSASTLSFTLDNGDVAFCDSDTAHPAQKMVFDGVTAGNHTLTIKNTGGAAIDIYAFFYAE